MHALWSSRCHLGVERFLVFMFDRLLSGTVRTCFAAVSTKLNGVHIFKKEFSRNKRISEICVCWSSNETKRHCSTWKNERNKTNSYIQKRNLEEQKNFSKYVCWSSNGDDIVQWTGHVQVQSLELRHNGHK